MHVVVGKGPCISQMDYLAE